MLKVALKGLAGRPVRALLTAIAIILGVAMISGTYILTDTINSGFDTIFSQSYKNADIVITGKAAFDNANGTTVEAPPMPESLLAKVQQLPDVALAAGSVTHRLAEADRQGREGDLERRRADARLLRHAGRAAVQPDQADRRKLAARQRPDRDRQGHRRRERLRRRRPDRRPGVRSRPGSC